MYRKNYKCKMIAINSVKNHVHIFESKNKTNNLKSEMKNKKKHNGKDLF